MQKSKIVQALLEYKEKYAWDKSLSKTSCSSPCQAPPVLIPAPAEDSCIDEFVRLNQDLYRGY